MDEFFEEFLNIFSNIRKNFSKIPQFKEICLFFATRAKLQNRVVRSRVQGAIAACRDRKNRKRFNLATRFHDHLPADSRQASLKM